MYETRLRQDLMDEGLLPGCELRYHHDLDNCNLIDSKGGLIPVDWTEKRPSISIHEYVDDEYNLLVRLDNGLWVRVVNIDFE